MVKHWELSEIRRVCIWALYDAGCGCLVLYVLLHSLQDCNSKWCTVVTQGPKYTPKIKILHQYSVFLWFSWDINMVCFEQMKQISAEVKTDTKWGECQQHEAIKQYFIVVRLKLPLKRTLTSPRINLLYILKMLSTASGPLRSPKNC